MTEWEKRDENLIVLLKPKFKNPLFGRYIFRFLGKPYYRINLDAIGSFIWERCDGKSTVRQIGKSLHQKFGDKVEPVYERLALFLMSLERGKFISYEESSEKAIE